MGSYASRRKLALRQFPLGMGEVSFQLAGALAQQQTVKRLIVPVANKSRYFSCAASWALRNSTEMSPSTGLSAGQTSTLGF